MDNTNLTLLLIVGAIVGASSGYLGSFMVVKRMSLVGDALSHVALPGIALAIMLGFNPMFGALIALFFTAIGIWYLEKHSQVYPEALVGIFFTTSLSLGLLLTPEPDLLEALFGNIDQITLYDGLIVIVGAVIIFFVTRLISRQMILSVVSEDLAKSQGINTSKINLIYLFLVSIVIALGIKFLGTLLTGAMVIIPAVSAKNLANGFKQFHLYSIFFGIIASVLGIFAAKFLGVSSGPTIVLTSVAVFVISFVFKKV